MTLVNRMTPSYLVQHQIKYEITEKFRLFSISYRKILTIMYMYLNI